jgi:hypothetical protein
MRWGDEDQDSEYVCSCRATACMYVAKRAGNGLTDTRRKKNQTRIKKFSRSGHPEGHS